MRTKSFEPSLSELVRSTQICKGCHSIGVIDRLNCDETKLLDSGQVEVDFKIVFFSRVLIDGLKY